MTKDNERRDFETPKILHDWPLMEASDEAQFKFTEYAVTLARLIANKETKTPFTLGVSGAWGSGKTTLLRRLQAMLDETRILLEPEKQERLSFVNLNEKPSNYRVCRTVWFNAWKYADEEQLLVALVRRIVQEMFRDDFVSKNAAALLEPFTPRRDVIDTVLSWFSIKTPLGDVKPNTGKPVATPLGEKTALLDLFDDAYNRLTAAWVHRKLDVEKLNPAEGVLVIFIDDLDRCLPAKMVQVLEAIKLFMDKRGCVFVLGADKDIIQQAVEKQYESAGVKGQTASDYLEKVIQLRFNLPPIPDEDMDSFVKSQVSDSVLSSHWRIVALGAESNPRKVKTFLNDLQLQWTIWQNTCQAENLDFDDFVRWEVLMRSAPAFRKRIFGIYDPAVRARLLENAFEWAMGKDDAAASFRADLNEQLQRVLKDIEGYKANYSPGLITRLIFLTTPTVPPASEERPLEKGPKQRTELRGSGERALEFGGLEFIKIPKGPFVMGSTKENQNASDYEQPQHTLDIPYDYYIGRFEVTNADYARFKDQGFKVPPGKENHPVVNVSWKDAMAYVAWLNQTHQASLPKGYVFGLPSEAEWEKAARGEFGNEWPWGNQFDAAKCNTGESRIKDTTPVAQFSPAGDSPYGVADMAGNVWEWTRSLWGKGDDKPDFKYPYDPKDGRENLDAPGEVRRVLRGGSFNYDAEGARCAYRYRYNPDLRGSHWGFRVVVSRTSHNSDL